jgi:hypothetical protein
MRHFVLKLSDGLYYKAGHSVGQAFHLANIYPEEPFEKMTEMLEDLVFVKGCIDDKVQLTEIQIQENNMMKDEYKI